MRIAADWQRQTDGWPHRLIAGGIRLVVSQEPPNVDLNQQPRMQTSMPFEPIEPTRRVLCYLIAAAFGCFAVYVDGRNDEVQAAVLVLLVGGVFIGLAGGRGAWIASVILGLSIIVSHPVANALHVGSAFARSGPNLGMLIAVVPALIGTGVGMVLRSGVQRAINQL